MAFPVSPAKRTGKDIGNTVVGLADLMAQAAIDGAWLAPGSIDNGLEKGPIPVEEDRPSFGGETHRLGKRPGLSADLGNSNTALIQAANDQPGTAPAEHRRADGAYVAADGAGDVDDLAAALIHAADGRDLRRGQVTVVLAAADHRIHSAAAGHTATVTTLTGRDNSLGGMVGINEGLLV